MDEFVQGALGWPGLGPDASEDKIKFFLQYGHQVASDEGNYDAFEATFPNFFEYRESLNPSEVKQKLNQLKEGR